MLLHAQRSTPQHLVQLLRDKLYTLTKLSGFYGQNTRVMERTTSIAHERYTNDIVLACREAQLKSQLQGLGDADE